MCALSGTDCSPPAPTLHATNSKNRHHVLSCRHVLPARGRRRCSACGPHSGAHARRRVGAAEASLAPQTLRRHGRALPVPSAPEEIDAQATLSHRTPCVRHYARAGQWPPVYSKLKTRACAAFKGGPAAAGQSPPPPCSPDTLFTSRLSSAHHLRPGSSPSRLGHARARSRSDASALSSRQTFFDNSP